MAWDGTNLTIVGSSPTGVYGTTHLDAVALNRTTGNIMHRCTMKKTATKRATATALDNDTFELLIDAKNPLVSPAQGTPAIDARYRVDFSASVINIAFTTDEFPSHGIRIMKDGLAISTEDVMNPSCINPLGAAGALELSRRLAGNGSNSGARTISLNPPPGPDSENRVPCA